MRSFDAMGDSCAPDDQLAHERLQALAGLQAGLARLRGIGSVSAILDRATEEVCRSCGFDRSILFRVRGKQMIAQSVHYAGDPDGAAALLAAARRDPPLLSHLLFETEMIRRRVPMLVLHPQDDPRVHRPLAVATASRSYVAAPVMPEGRVIGFLHADRHFQGRHVDEFDRDLLWVFAEGFGYAIHRTVLLERLRAQRDQVTEMMAATAQLMTEICEAEVEVEVADAGQGSSATQEPAVRVTAPPLRLRSLLTPREVEVIRLMAAGETNAGIASRLVISEGTVKSHVKHILRKLSASNRAEAVSRYLQLTAPAATISRY
jgi:DNA-binding CsgD family transcriptional regulator